MSWINIRAAVIAICLTYCNGTAWSDLFLDADLTFLFTHNGDMLIDVDTDFPYFQVVRDENSYTPLRHLVLFQSIFATTGTNLLHSPLRKHGYRYLEKSARPKIVFINLAQSATWKWTCADLILHSGASFRQEFVFGHIHYRKDLFCLHRHVRFLGKVKLVLLEGNLTPLLFVPCLTCDLTTLSEVKTLSLLGIRQAWDDQHSDFHKYFIFLPIRISGKSTMRQDGMANMRDFNFCPVATIAERYNLTLLDHRKSDAMSGLNSFGYAYIVVNNYSVYPTRMLYDVGLKVVNFITITNPPAPESGLTTFISPFDIEVWGLLFVSVFSVAGFLTFIRCQGEYHGTHIAAITQGETREKYISFAILMIDEVIAVIVIFLGQAGQSSQRSCHKGKVALMLLTLWLFGNLVLMVNYYQGSIYSCLAVLFPPQTPRGIDELIDLDIPIVSMDMSLSKTNVTYLKDVIIPELIYNDAVNPKFKKFLIKFQAKLLSIIDSSVDRMFHQIIRENSKRTYPPMVISNLEETFKILLTYAGYLGNRHLVQNIGESPFQVAFFKIGHENLFTPYLAKGLRHMQESGLTQWWSNLEPLLNILNKKKILSKLGKYFQAVQESLETVRKQIIFHESNAISLDLILPAFSFCGLLILISMAQFLAENVKLLRHWGKIVLGYFSPLVDDVVPLEL